MRINVYTQQAFGAALITALLADGHTLHRVTVPDYDTTTRAVCEALGMHVLVTRSTAPRGQKADTYVLADPEDPAEIGVACGWTEFVPPAERSWCVPFGVVGYHPSILPAYPGRNAINQWLEAQQLAGQVYAVCGGCLYQLEDGWDDGAVLRTTSEMIHLADYDGPGDLFKRWHRPNAIDLIRLHLRSLGTPDRRLTGIRIRQHDAQEAT